MRSLEGPSVGKEGGMSGHKHTAPAVRHESCWVTHQQVSWRQNVNNRLYIALGSSMMGQSQR